MYFLFTHSQLPVNPMPVRLWTDTQGWTSWNLWSAECRGHCQRQHRTEHTPSPRTEIKIPDPTINWTWATGLEGRTPPIMPWWWTICISSSNNGRMWFQNVLLVPKSTKDRTLCTAFKNLLDANVNWSNGKFCCSNFFSFYIKNSPVCILPLFFYINSPQSGPTYACNFPPNLITHTLCLSEQ